MWFGQTGLNVNRFETGLSASVNGALVATGIATLMLWLLLLANIAKTTLVSVKLTAL